MANPAFDLVNEFSQMRARAMQGMGNGPYGQVRYQPRRVGKYAVPQRARQAQQQPTVGPDGLVDWGGRKIHSSVVRYADEMRRLFPGLRFSSGWRDPVTNARVNGVKNSYHLKGRALDWSGPAKDMQAARAWALQNGAREALIHNAGSGTHLHVAW